LTARFTGRVFSTPFPAAGEAGFTREVRLFDGMNKNGKAPARSPGGLLDNIKRQTMQAQRSIEQAESPPGTSGAQKIATKGREALLTTDGIDCASRVEREGSAPGIVKEISPEPPL
jgi:hypothetical protein